MDANSFAPPASYQLDRHVLTFLIFTLVAIPNITQACNTTTVPFNATHANYQNTIIPSNYNTKTNHENTTAPSNYTPNYYDNTAIPSNYTQSYHYEFENTTIPSNNYTQDYHENTSNDINPSNHNHTQSQTCRSYIKTACNSTTYPSICYQSLSPYALKIEADPMKLCNTSLLLALKAAHSASSIISKLLENNNLTHMAEQVVQDCLENVKDSIVEVQDSVGAMEHLDGMDREYQISNIKTWVSAALTDDQTCSDGFDGGNVDVTVRDTIRKCVLNVARMSSNALYFVNNLIY